MDNKRDYFLDYLKGLTIVLVVIGHCIQNSYVQFDKNIYFRVIYSFHMPLFMFLAGKSAKITLENKGKIDICKKTTTLVLPFFAWYILNYFINKPNVSMLDYIKSLIWSVDYGLWFLWILFLNYFTLWIFFIGYNMFTKKTTNNSIFWNYIQKISLVWIGVIFFISLFFRTSFLGIELYRIYYIWFIIGFCFYDLVKNFTFISNKISIKIIKNGIILSFLYLSSFWMRTEAPLFINALEHFVGMPFIISAIVQLYNFIVPLIGIISFVIIAGHFYLMNSFVKKICYLGGNTLGIYAVHMNFIISKIFVISMYNVFAKTIISIAFSLLLVLVMKQSMLLGVLFLGKIKVNNQ